MSADEAKPLIVFGMGRSGTRMCANILNNSQAVELQGEIGGPAGTKMMAWLEAIRLQRGDADHERMYRLARSAFRDSAASRPLERPEARWFGHKTPRHERHFRRYEVVFSDPACPAHYVYCLRNPFHVWRSYRAMPWNKFKDVRAFLEAWNRSVHMYENMLQVAPGRVLTFNLDEMIRAADRMEWLRPNLLEPLGVSEATFRKPVEALRNSNSAANKLGMEPTDPPATDMAQIAADRAAADAVRAYFPWMEDEMERYLSDVPRRKRLFARWGT